MKQIINDNKTFEELSKYKQMKISKLTIDKNEVSSTLLPLREEKYGLALQYKNQVQNVKKYTKKIRR